MSGNHEHRWVNLGRIILIKKGREKEEKIKVNIKRVACKDNRDKNWPSKGLIEKITIDMQ